MSFSSILEAWSADPGTVAVLVGVLWLDGWRRAGRSDLVLVRPGLGLWTERAPWARVGPFALVGWWPPIVMPLLVSATQSAGHGDARPPWSADFFVATSRGRRRLRRVRLIVGTLRTLGVLLLAWIALAIPLATGRFGVHGLVRAIVQAFVMAGVMALGTALGLRWLGMTRRASLLATLPLLFPFTAPRACELVVDAAVRDLDPLARIAALLGDTRFLLWIRPWAYDELHGRRDPRGAESEAIAALVHTLPRVVLERAVRSPPSEESAGRYCPRCARSYRDDITSCHDCDALALVGSRVMGRGS